MSHSPSLKEDEFNCWGSPRRFLLTTPLGQGLWGIIDKRNLGTLAHQGDTQFSACYSCPTGYDVISQPSHVVSPLPFLFSFCYPPPPPLLYICMLGKIYYSSVSYIWTCCCSHPKTLNLCWIWLWVFSFHWVGIEYIFNFLWDHHFMSRETINMEKTLCVCLLCSQVWCEGTIYCFVNPELLSSFGKSTLSFLYLGQQLLLYLPPI